MDFLRLRVKVTFVEECLGLDSGDKDIQSKFISSKIPDGPDRSERIAMEIAATSVEDVVDNQKTIFPKDINGVPLWHSHQWGGYFKDACGALSKCKGSKGFEGAISSNLKAYKKVINGNIFFRSIERVTLKNGATSDEYFPIILPEGGEFGRCERPLRADTPQGNRVALAASETIPAGSTSEFYIYIADPQYLDYVYEWLDYGIMRGTGQWRNSGKGRFTYEVTDLKKVPLPTKNPRFVNGAIVTPSEDNDSTDNEDTDNEAIDETSVEAPKKHRGRPKKSAADSDGQESLDL